jgi:gliding motility-associated peptidyl-prolyl isomerase
MNWKNQMRRYSLILVLLLIYSCSGPTPRKPVSHHTQSFMVESVNLNKKINSIEEDAIKYYIARDSASNYYNSPNGFWYKYLIQSDETNPIPSIGDEVEFEYEISDLLDNVIYSNETLGVQKYSIDKENIESGIQNGLKLMKEKEEVVFLFPSFSAFGFSGDKEKIGIKQPLIYKVKLNKINRKNESN